jgi:hypothetical protein
MSLKCKIGLHIWTGCKCSGCGKIRDEQHDWSKDCEECSKCGKTRENQHKSNGSKCSMCGKDKVYSYDYVLNEVKKSMDEQDEKKRSDICVAILKLEGNCLTCLTKIVLDKNLNFYTRRWALKIASGFRGEQLYEFIKLNCLAGKTKGELLRARNGTEEIEAKIALFVTGEEILNTKDFFDRFMTK